MNRTLTLGPVTLALPLEADLRHPGVSYVDSPPQNGDPPLTHAKFENDGHRQLALLFAASPDLLLAAEAVVESCQGDRLGRVLTSDIDALRAAIARARGGT